MIEGEKETVLCIGKKTTTKTKTVHTHPLCDVCCTHTNTHTHTHMQTYVQATTNSKYNCTRGTGNIHAHTAAIGQSEQPHIERIEQYETGVVRFGSVYNAQLYK